VGKTRRTEVTDPDLVGRGGAVGEEEPWASRKVRARERDGAPSRTREQENTRVRVGLEVCRASAARHSYRATLPG
jgi:hypothetical protein